MITAFAAPLVVTVTANNPSEPVAGGLVTFTAPSSGASTNPAVITATIDGSGDATVAVIANGVAGMYTVAASASGVTSPADFTLTNTDPGNGDSVILAPPESETSPATITSTNAAAPAVPRSREPQSRRREGGLAGRR